MEWEKEEIRMGCFMIIVFGGQKAHEEREVGPKQEERLLCWKDF